MSHLIFFQWPPYVEPNEYGVSGVELCDICNSIDFYITISALFVLLTVSYYIRKIRLKKIRLISNILFIGCLIYIILFSKFPVYDLSVGIFGVFIILGFIALLLLLIFVSFSIIFKLSNWIFKTIKIKLSV